MKLGRLTILCARSNGRVSWLQSRTDGGPTDRAAGGLSCSRRAFGSLRSLPDPVVIALARDAVSQEALSVSVTEIVDV